jgi:hypothetical protein
MLSLHILCVRVVIVAINHISMYLFSPSRDMTRNLGTLMEKPVYYTCQWTATCSG